MTSNPYHPPGKSGEPRTRLGRRSAWWSYGILNASLIGLLALPVLLLVVERWLAPYFTESTLNGDPVTYQHVVYIEPPSLLFLAIYFYIPNAILRFLRRRTNQSRS